MARIRTVKPEFWSDASVIALAFEHRLLFIGLWNFADDKGFIENRPTQIKINVFPADDVDIARGIRALKKEGLVDVVKLGDKSVIKIVTWKHQRIDKPQPSQFAALYDEYQGEQPIPRTFQERSQNVPAGGDRKGKEGKGKEVPQVGGGGHLSSDDASEPPPPISEHGLQEPWRCARHQGVDVSCYACKDAKAAHKAHEAQQAKDTKAAARAAERARNRDAIYGDDTEESVPMPDDLRQALRTIASKP